MRGVSIILAAVLGGAAAGVFAALALTHTRSFGGRLDVLDVGRINVREADGRLRLVIAAKDRFPGLITRGRERPFVRDVAGVIFFNDEGTENGGLTFDGRAAAAETPTSSGSLTFDPYQQDQALMLAQSEEGGRRSAGLTVYDRPNGAGDMPGMLALRDREPQAFADAVRAGRFGRARLFLGRTEAAEAMLALRDAAGRPRLRLSVSPDGRPSIEFLDASGRVVRRVSPT